MVMRNIVTIDEEKCTGCGDCVPACAEGAIEIIDGVAKLKADNLCDGLGACLGECPFGAIQIESRDADEFDESAVDANLRTPEAKAPTAIHSGGCPGSRMLHFENTKNADSDIVSVEQKSALRQWPVQLHLVSPSAPYFNKADLLLAADCVAFSVGDFHSRWLKSHALAIACPKLDSGQEVYLNKLVAMIDNANINTLTVMIMEVPCCGGLLRLAMTAVEQATRKVPVKLVKVGIRGDILDEAWV